MAGFADEVAALRGTRSATLRDLLTHPPFSRLLAAMTVSSFGDWVGFVAVTALVARLGRTPGGAAFAVSGVMIARMLPAILFGPFAGAIVDRLDRKQVMIVADVARAAMYSSMPFLGELWAIYLLSFAIECLSLLWTPARDASLPRLVPRRQLANANSIGLITAYGTLPFGGAAFAALAGVAEGLSARVPYLGARPEALALWADAGTFLFSAVMLTGVPIRTPAARRAARVDLTLIGRDIVEGLRFLREHPLARAMTTGIVVAFSAVGAVLALGPVFATQTLGAGSAGWGVLVTAFGVGMGVGMAAVSRAARAAEIDHVFSWSLLAAAATLFVLASMPNLSLASVLAVVLGFFCGATWVSGYVLLQENVPDEYRGRTFGSLTVLGRLGLFVSLVAFPALAAIYGDHEAYVGGQRLDLSGTRLALATVGLGVIAAGILTRLGLRRHRLSKPVPLTLVPRLRRPPAAGLFVVFEGVEGSGKGTQIERAAAFLRERGCDVLVTREPGGTEVGEALRELLLSVDTGRLEPRAEALLFAAARAQHVATVIRPALAEGKVVLCDRYVDSSLAYQGWGRGLGEQDVLTLNVWATQGLFPDLVILLHLEPEEGLRRIGREPDRIEAEGPGFLDKVSDAYLRIAEEHPERFVVVDAGRPEEEVAAAVREALLRLLKEREENHPEGAG